MSDMFSIMKLVARPEVPFPSYEDIRTLIHKHRDNETITYDVCVRDCVIFRDSKYDFKYQFEMTPENICPKCGEPRYTREDVNNNIAPRARKQFIYAPLSDYIRSQFLDSLRPISEKQPKTKYPRVLTCVQDSPGWRKNVLEDSVINSDDRNIVMSIATDGVPIDRKWSTKSITVIVARREDVSEDIKNKPEAMHLFGVAPCGFWSVDGTKYIVRTPKSMAPYLHLVVDCHIKSYTKGVSVVDPVKEDTFPCKSKLIFGCGDYPGNSKAFAKQGANAIYGCCWCWMLGEHCAAVNKCIYKDHRRYLPLDPPHPWRSDPRFGEPEMRPPPANRTHEEAVKFGKMASASGAAVKGYSGLCEFFRLPYLMDIISSQMIDFMHIPKGIFQSHLFPLLKGDSAPQPPRLPRFATKAGLLRGCSVDQISTVVKDVVATERARRNAKIAERRIRSANAARSRATPNVNMQAREANRRTQEEKHTNLQCESLMEGLNGQWLSYEKKKKDHAANVSLQASWKKSEDKMTQADELLANIKGPLGWFRKGLAPGTRTGNMKCADWHMYILYCAELHLSQMLSAAQYAVVVNLITVLKQVMDDTFDLDTADALQLEVIEALCDFERALPKSELVIVLHLVIHLVAQCKKWGPLRVGWMYAFERYFGWLIKLLKSKKSPEVGLMRMHTTTKFSAVLSPDQRDTLWQAVSSRTTSRCLQDLARMFAPTATDAHLTGLVATNRVPHHRSSSMRRRGDQTKLMHESLKDAILREIRIFSPSVTKSDLPANGKCLATDAGVYIGTDRIGAKYEQTSSKSEVYRCGVAFYESVILPRNELYATHNLTHGEILELYVVDISTRNPVLTGRQRCFTRRRIRTVQHIVAMIRPLYSCHSSTLSSFQRGSGLPFVDTHRIVEGPYPLYVHARRFAHLVTLAPFLERDNVYSANSTVKAVFKCSKSFRNVL
jgi:hypothetical protein